ANVVPSGQANPSMEAEPMGPIWCYNLAAPTPITRKIDAWGGWEDHFDTNIQMGRFQDGDMDYRIFNQLIGSQSSWKTGLFINNNHWMEDFALLDTVNNLSGGTLVSPNKNFKFENGKLIIEVDVAAGAGEFGGADVFTEI